LPASITGKIISGQYVGDTISAQLGFDTSTGNGCQGTGPNAPVLGLMAQTGASENITIG
jgi:hypothetical protein